MDIIKELERTRDQTLEYFKLESSDLSKSYASGKWTVLQLLHHLADAESVLYDRIRRTISKPNQVLWAFDQDAWARELDYKNVPLELNRNIYKNVRNAIILYADKHYSNSDKKTYVHSETGLRSLQDEFEKVVWHNDHHLQQIHTALKS